MFIGKHTFLAARFTLMLVLLSGVLFRAEFTLDASAAAGDVTRVSVAGDGSQSNGYSDWPTLSSNGLYAAFYSGGSNLVAGDSNGFTDAFIRDMQTGTVQRVSVNSSGGQSNADSHDAVISADGRYVSFISLATNLTSHTDTANSYDVFVHDVQTGITSAVSVSLNNDLGTSGRNAYHQSISADGRYIAFNSSRTNMVAGDTNLLSDIFVRDMQTGTTIRVSVGPNGTQSNGDSFYSNMSEDGRYITFHSGASNLVAGDTNGRIDVFVRDVQSGVTSRVSVASGAAQAVNGDSLYPALSADGRYVVFRSAATNLVPGDTNAQADIFLHDRQTGITTLVSVPSTGGWANGDSLKAAVSQDGRYVTYDSYATNLVPGDSNGQGDVFVRDTQLGITTRVSVASGGAQAVGGEAMYPSMTPNGQYIVFTSFATNMVPGDSNAVADIFMYEQAVSGVPTAAATFTSVAPSATSTFTPFPTATFTSSPAATFTSTSTSTNTPLPSSTSTPLPTETFTFTATQVNTATWTPTFTPSPTATAQDTATFTSTSVPSATFTRTPTFTPTPVNTLTFTPTVTVTPSVTQALYLSLLDNQTVAGIVSADEDILKLTGQTWSLFFDGSDVGLAAADLFAFSFIDPDSILMAFSTSVTVNGIAVTPQDIVRFDATSLGANTAGTFSMYFDGSDVGLTVAAESLDSVSLLADGRVLISTTGNPSVNGLSGNDEDVLAFTPTSLGNVTAGTWQMYFDGSDVGLADTNNEDVDALEVTSNGSIYLSTVGDFAVSGVSGSDEDVFVCVPTSIGNATVCNYVPGLYFDGSLWGLAANDVDAFGFAGP